METHGYGKTTSDHYVFVKKFIVMILFFSYFYVGDMLIVGHDK